MLLRCVLLIAVLMRDGLPHVIFMEPPARQSIGVLRPQCNLPVNYNGNGVYCGGMIVMHNELNKGRCAICGDEYSALVKPHQSEAAGGIYSTGTIARSYLPGQLIDVTIDMLAHHKGFLTFALCPHNNVNTDPDRSCFFNNPLQVDNNRTHQLTAGTGIRTMKVQLPNIECSQCIFQYTYTAGNNPGKGPQSQEVQSEDCGRLPQVEKMGCGFQETFRGCADICIGTFCPKGECAKVGDIALRTALRTPTTPATTPTTPVVTPITQETTPITPVTTPTTPATTPTKMCKYAGVKHQYFSYDKDKLCKLNCENELERVCHQSENIRLLCYCDQTSSANRDYQTVRVFIASRIKRI